MTLLGAHVSIAGGYHRAVERGADLGLPVIQIFSKNQVRLISNAPDASVFDRYFRTRDAHPEVRMICAHGSYLYNFASPDDSLAGRSIESLCGELRIGERMNIPYLVVHPGSHMGEGEIGFDAFRFIMNDKQFLSLPKIIETPKKRNGNDMDRKNIDVLLGLVENDAKCGK